MKSLNLKFPFKDLNGEVVKDATGEILLSKLLATELSKKSDGIGPLKASEMAESLWNEGSLTVDTTDLDKLKTFVTNCDLFNLPKGQILRLIREYELA